MPVFCFHRPLTGLQKVLLVAAALVCVCAAQARAEPSGVTYPILTVRAPRFGDSPQAGSGSRDTRWQEVFLTYTGEAGTDLVIIYPDGREEVLVAGGDKGVVADPVVSFDGKWVYYAFYTDMTGNSQRQGVPIGGSDIWKINIATREKVRLTSQEWTPNTGVTQWASAPTASEKGKTSLGFGVFNLGPCPVPGGKIVFTSTRNNLLPTKGFAGPIASQLFVMDEDGKNVELISPMTLGSALHPVILTDGRIIFSSYESQGLRDNRVWSLWYIYPDGRKWGPMFSSFNGGLALHWGGQLSNGEVVQTGYYNLNNKGFGTVYGFQPHAAEGKPAFGSLHQNDPSNPPVEEGIWWFNDSHPSHKKWIYEQFRFSPPGLRSMAHFAHHRDEASSLDLNGNYSGKVTQPSGAPGNDLLLVYSPGPANALGRPVSQPWVQGEIRVIKGGTPVDWPTQMTVAKSDVRYNYQQPKALVSYRDIYGIEEPLEHPFLPNDGSISSELPAGTPFGLIGSASLSNRDTDPDYGAGLFNSGENYATTSWNEQGTWGGKYTDADIAFVRLLAMETSSALGYTPEGFDGSRKFYNAASERLRILGEIPVRKRDAQGNEILDYTGIADTSFIAKIPADTPFTFQTLDRNGMVLNMAQTWHQVRPGESRMDCGGCHAHNHLPVDITKTAAVRPDYKIWDLTKQTPLLSRTSNGEMIVGNSPTMVNVEYYRDIKPILQRSCVQCHSTTGRREANLSLDDQSNYSKYRETPIDFEVAYMKLAFDPNGTSGYAPLVGTWRYENMSRFVRAFQSRRSLLIWKVFGRRLDGYLNSDFPTERTPGDATTFPADANKNTADIDFTGTAMPPPGSGVPALTEDEKLTMARWVDLGAPIETSNITDRARAGWFVDDQRPTLTVSEPRGGVNNKPLRFIRIGAFDAYTRYKEGSLSVRADFTVDGVAPGGELAGKFTSIGDGIWSYSLSSPITSLPQGTLTVRVSDVQGNISEVRRSIAVRDAARPLAPTDLNVEPRTP